MRNPGSNVTPTRQFQPAGVGVYNEIHTAKWATKTFLAGAIPISTDFFLSAPSGDLTRDNYDQGGILETSGKIFTIYAIAATIIASSTSTFADLVAFLERCSLQITSQNKEIGLFPLDLVPAGGGISALSGQISVTAAAVPGAASPLGVGNGLPIRKLLELNRPLEIQSQQSFRMTLLSTAGVPAGFPAATLIGPLDLRITLEGIEQRPAA